MDLIEIQCKRDLAADPGTEQQGGSFSYKIDPHQFIAAHSAWKHSEPPSTLPLALTTLAGDKIWMSDRETAQVADAIRSSRASVALE